MAIKKADRQHKLNVLCRTGLNTDPCRVTLSFRSLELTRIAIRLRVQWEPDSVREQVTLSFLLIPQLNFRHISINLLD